MEKPELVNLVNKAKQGDNEAFSALYAEAFNNVYYTAKKILQNEDSAQEVTQEVFLFVYQNIGRLEQPEAFFKWVQQTAAYMCYNLRRKKTEVLYAPLAGDEGDSGLPDVEDDIMARPEELLVTADVKQIILSIIDRLSDEQRAAVMMFYFQELPIKTIAEVMQTNENTIKSRLNYARKQIRLGVEQEEKASGIRLHSISAVFLLELFKENAAGNIGNAAYYSVYQALQQQIAAGVAGGMGTAGASAAGGAAAGAASSTASAAGAVGTAAAKTGLSFGMKIVVGITAATVAVASGAGIANAIQRPSAPAISITAQTDYSEIMAPSSIPQVLASSQEIQLSSNIEGVSGGYTYYWRTKTDYGEAHWLAELRLYNDSTFSYSIGVENSEYFGSYLGGYTVERGENNSVIITLYGDCVYYAGGTVIDLYIGKHLAANLILPEGEPLVSGEYPVVMNVTQGEPIGHKSGESVIYSFYPYSEANPYYNRVATLGLVPPK